jgi:aspartate racemase
VVGETRSALLNIIDRMKETEAIEGVLLAGTELSLILTEESYKGIRFFDTTKIHVQRAIEEMI